MKPRVFVGSSRESVLVAQAIQDNLKAAADVRVWTQGTAIPGKTIQESLLEELHRSDFGVFVLAPDDIAQIRDRQFAVARDNVIWELGLFTGLLGRDRVFMVVPEKMPDLRIPNDLLGVHPLDYRHPEGTPKFFELLPALGPACSRLEAMITERGTFGRTAFIRHLTAGEVLQEVGGLAGLWLSRFEFESGGTKGIQYDVEVLKKAGPRTVVGHVPFACSSNGKPYRHTLCAEIFGRQIIGLWVNVNTLNLGALHLSMNTRGTVMVGMHLGNSTENVVRHGCWQWLRLEGEERDLRTFQAPEYESLDRHFNDCYSLGKSIPLGQLFGGSPQSP